MRDDKQSRWKEEEERWRGREIDEEEVERKKVEDEER